MTDQKITNPVKAIRAKCLDCSNNSATEVRLCPIKECPLYQFRFGKNPHRAKREMTEEQRAVCAERLRAARKQKDLTFSHLLEGQSVA